MSVAVGYDAQIQLKSFLTAFQELKSTSSESGMDRGWFSTHMLPSSFIRTVSNTPEPSGSSTMVHLPASPSSKDMAQMMSKLASAFDKTGFKHLQWSQVLEHASIRADSPMLRYNSQ